MVGACKWHPRCFVHNIMPRPIWKGSISFGLVTVPVGLYAATERAAEIRFRLLHAKDASPIDYKRVCEAEGVEVPWDQIVRGYEHTKGQYVVMTDTDLARARVEATQTFAIRDFVPAHAIDVLHYDQPYYLAPTSKAASKAYALLREALAESGRVGVGTLVLRQREHLAALAPSGRVLALTTLRYADEIRSIDALEVPAATRADKRELALARQLIDTLARDWDPTRYRDSYRDVLLKVIEQKAKGEPVSPPARRKPAPVVDLMDALRRSLAEPRRTPARATGHGRRSSRRPARRAA
jgi:DNA end-binding protein Ku